MLSYADHIVEDVPASNAGRCPSQTISWKNPVFNRLAIFMKHFLFISVYDFSEYFSYKLKGGSNTV